MIREALEALYLCRHGWTRSTMKGIEPVWVSPRGVRATQTELGIIVCLQHEAVYRQRALNLGLTPA